MERENQLLERDVRRIRTRQESLLTIRHLKWKKSWMVLIIIVIIIVSFVIRNMKKLELFFFKVKKQEDQLNNN